jgi:hypothetical protein
VPTVLVTGGGIGELIGGEGFSAALIPSGVIGCGTQRRMGVSVVALDGGLNGSVA